MLSSPTQPAWGSQIQTLTILRQTNKGHRVVSLLNSLSISGLAMTTSEDNLGPQRTQYGLAELKTRRRQEPGVGGGESKGQNKNY